MDSDKIKQIKVTTIGDGAVGKTIMIVTYTTKKFPKRSILTVFDNYFSNITVDGEEFDTTLLDISGLEDFDRLRPLYYPNTDVFIICYSIDSRASYENIEAKWIPEINYFSPTIPIILVGTKADLRTNTLNKKFITVDEGEKLKKKINAVSFVECSALHQQGLREVFEEAVRAIPKRRPVQSKTCTFL